MQRGGADALEWDNATRGHHRNSRDYEDDQEPSGHARDWIRPSYERPNHNKSFNVNNRGRYSAYPGEHNVVSSDEDEDDGFPTRSAQRERPNVPHDSESESEEDDHARRQNTATMHPSRKSRHAPQDQQRNPRHYYNANFNDEDDDDGEEDDYGRGYDRRPRRNEPSPRRSHNHVPPVPHGSSRSRKDSESVFIGRHDTMQSASHRDSAASRSKSSKAKHQHQHQSPVIIDPIKDLELKVDALSTALTRMNSEIRTIVQKNHNAVSKELDTLKSESFMCYGQVIAPGVKIYSDLPSNLKKQGINDDAKIAKLCSPVSVQEGETLVLRTVYAESPDIGGKDYVWMKCYMESPDVNGREFQWMKCYSIKSDTAAVHMRYVQVRNLATDKPLVGNISLLPPTLTKSPPSITTAFLKTQNNSGNRQHDSSDCQQQQENDSDQGEEGEEEISKAEDFSNVVFQAPFDIART